MRTLGLAWIVAWMGCAGCNTDPMWEPSQRARGPLGSIDRPDGVGLPDIRIADAHEVDMVEQVLTHRAMYHRSLQALHDYYQQHGYESKRTWTLNELADVKRIRPYRYILDAEIPSSDLQPRDSIAEADAMFERGLVLLKEGGHNLPFVYREGRLREALATFRELIERYPSSDKIDDAAFYCGEIHKEYFKGEEPLAIRWYERAFTWNPQIQLPARFQAAVVYDYRLHDRDRALELYQDVRRVETFNQSNVIFAVARIEQLTSDRLPHAPEPNVGRVLGAPADASRSPNQP